MVRWGGEGGDSSCGPESPNWALSTERRPGFQLPKHIHSSCRDAGPKGSTGHQDQCHLQLWLGAPQVECCDQWPAGWRPLNEFTGLGV